ncbi:MAG: proteasome accessory factor PafA2 family protein [Candidatus Nitrohelix vancouverensis]|uniref:Proteasome accessory factor PafA2 family protein n=1 Tax=Candidatus Nitrohelix vancouverensis TaxID=2705534 RepID=A0A7T0G2L6_9BACT|nr:MAG: proteasome accessory factor PafA2 family protein [Candidatus Nitrohelix vancouverensis]
MKKRIYGLETEYGLLIKDTENPIDPVEAAYHIKDHIFSNKKVGVLDMHYRANDEPPGNGGFMLNGGRIYLDMGHLEYASPECSSLVDLLTYDRAGDEIIQEAVEELGWGERIAIIKNNVDLETNATFGCHENYLASRELQLEDRDNLKLLAAFLVTRQIYCGAGRIGACNPHPFRDWDEAVQETAEEETVKFQLSQRADHIPNEFYRWVQYNRAIVNTRDEPLADPSKFRRIHLLVGDSNISEFSTALKMGCTSLMLELMERGAASRDWILSNSVFAMSSISRDPEFKWEIQLRNGTTTTALDLQRSMLERAKSELGGSSLETDWILGAWENVLDDLPKGPEALIGRVDWATKLWMLGEFQKEENLDWNDPWMKSLDLEYHNLNKQQGLYWGLEESGDAYRKTSDEAIQRARQRAPRRTRAQGRGELVQALLTSQVGYLIDWIGFRLSDSEEPFLMLDPFRTYSEEIAERIKELKNMEIDDNEEASASNPTSS